jgi:hypothetical protein
VEWEMRRGWENRRREGKKEVYMDVDGAPTKIPGSARGSLGVHELCLKVARELALVFVT